MSESKDIKSMFASLPSVTDSTGKSVVLTDADGNRSKKPLSDFCKPNQVLISPNGCLKVTGFTHAFFSARMNLADACSLHWISTYGQGYGGRTTCSKIAGTNIISIYINGTSTGTSTIFVKNTSTAQYVNLSVMPCDECVPILTTVDAIPSDATLLNT